MVIPRDLYVGIKTMLSQADTDSPDFTAKCIMEQAFGKSFPMILADRDTPLDPEKVRSCFDMAEKRAEGRPLQYILGEWEFFGYPFIVGEGVLIPRPDTETLVEQVIKICRDENISLPKIADLCSGSGCIAVSLKKELPEARITAVELSDEAIPYIQKNAALNHADINIVQADVLQKKTAKELGKFDIIVSNPPYLNSGDMKRLQKEVSFEPEIALFGGIDGLDFYRNITALWKDSLVSNGFIAFEFGMDQHEAVSGILQHYGFKNIQLSRDTAGIIRTAAAQI